MPTEHTNENASHLDGFARPSCELLNRAFEVPSDGWYQIVPLGTWPVLDTLGGTSKEIQQVIDARSIKALAEGFSGELLIDYEHFAHNPDKETRAAGWITGVQERQDGLYAQIRWSTQGEADVKGGAYRFISPEFDQVSPMPGNPVGSLPLMRPVRLSGAALTNKPNLTTLRPLSNRSADGSGQNTTTNTKTMDYKALILKVLGLPATATDQEIQAAADKLGDTSAPEMAQEVEAMNRDLKTAREALADRDLEGVALDDETKATVREALVANRAKGLKIVEALRKTQQPEPQAALFNRAKAQPPKASESLAARDKAEEARAAKISNRAHEIARTEKVAFGVAWAKAEAEIPA